MTQEPLPPALIPDGYALARLMAEDRRTAIRAIQNASDRKIDEVDQQLDVMEQAYGIHRQPDPMRRLAAYLQKDDAPGLPWKEQRAKFPRDYEEDYEDYQELRERARRGEFS